MWPRIARTLLTYREAALWYLLVATAVTMMVASGQDQGHPAPLTPSLNTLPPVVAMPPPTTVAPPPTEPPPTPTATTTPPPTTAGDGEAPPASSATETTGAETRPEQVGADGQPVAQPPEEPPPPTSVPPTTNAPPDTTAPVVTVGPTTTRLPRNKANGLPDADDLEVCVYEQAKNLIQRPCRD